MENMQLVSQRWVKPRPIKFPSPEVTEGSWRRGGGRGCYKLSVSSEMLDAKSISDLFVCILQYLHRLYWLSISNLEF